MTTAGQDAPDLAVLGDPRALPDGWTGLAVPHLVFDDSDRFLLSSAPFGMGLYVVDGTVAGQLRLTTVTKAKTDHVERHIKPNQAGVPNEYAHNIQVAELNALNAPPPVLRSRR